MRNKFVAVALLAPVLLVACISCEHGSFGSWVHGAGDLRHEARRSRMGSKASAMLSDRMRLHSTHPRRAFLHWCATSATVSSSPKNLCSV